MSRFHIMEKSWNQYLKEVLPKEAGQVQIDETKKAFYAGALQVILTLERMGKSDDADEEAAAQVMADVAAEVRRFAAQEIAKARFLIIEKANQN